MSRIDEARFWSERLQVAKSISKNSERMIHYSVFRVSEQEWNKIQKNHERVVLETIDTDNDRVLDIGCAFGRNYITSIKNYTGIDLSPDFIKEAQRRFPEKEFINVRMEDYFPDQKFDWGICSSIKEMIRRENGIEDWAKKEEHLKNICKKILILEYTPAMSSNYVATEIIEGY